MADLTTIATFHRGFDAETARLALKQAGIDAYLDSANLVATNALFANAVGGIKLQVADFDAAAAHRILEEAKAVRARSGEAILEDAGSHAIVFDCEECGETITFADEFAGRCEVCPHCGEYIDVPESTEYEPSRRESFCASDATSSGAPAPAVHEPRDPAALIAAGTKSLPGEHSGTPAFASAADRRRIWLEVLIVLCMAYVPSLYATLRSLADGEYLDESSSGDFTYDYADLLLYSSVSTVFALYIIARGGDSWATFGVARLRWIRDPLLATFCLAIDLAGQSLLWNATSSGPQLFDFMIALDGVSSRAFASIAASELPAQLLVVIATLVAAYSEELVYRGYLITRLGPLLHSSWTAVFVAAVLFGSFHAYQGSDGALSAFMTGVIYGGLFLWLRRLWPLAIAHALYNLSIAYF